MQRERSIARDVAAGLAIALAALLWGCGGGGASPAPELPLLFDSLGRQLPEAEFGRGDREAAGADGIAFDGGPSANAQVTLADNAGNTRTATTDAAGYYRVSVKGLSPPFVVKARRADGTDWVSASASAVRPRGFVTINVNGVTDKMVGYLSDAAGNGGAAGAITPSIVATNAAALAAAKARVVYGLTVPLINAGLDAAVYDPVTAAFGAAAAASHETFLRGLVIRKDVQGRTTVVGTIAGTPATLNYPSGVAVDAAGDVYVADANKSAILKISPTGMVSTLAGGASGFSDGAGSAAAFSFPSKLGFDAVGNLYVLDAGNSAIRKITPAGFVTTLAGGLSGGTNGTGAAATPDFGSMAVDAAGNVHVSDMINGVIRKVSPAGVVTVLASTASFSRPNALAFDAAGNLYVAELPAGGINGAIRRMTPAGVISTVYTPRAQDTGFMPAGIVVGAGGTVYIADTLARRILQLTPDGALASLAGGSSFNDVLANDGAGASARFATPLALALDASGNLFVADAANSAIRKVTATGNVSTLAGKRTGFTDGAATVARFDQPTGIAVDAAGRILVADKENHAIRLISRTGVVTTVAGNGTGGFVNGNAAAARFLQPTGVTADGAGNIFVAEGNHVIRKISPAGEVTTFAGNEYGYLDGPALTARFAFPRSVVADRGGNLYVADLNNASIRKVTPAGVVSTLAGRGPVTELPWEVILARGFTDVGGAVALDANGLVYIPAWVPLPGLARFAIFSVDASGALAPRSALYSDRTDPGLAVDSHGNVYYGRGAAIYQVTPAGVETEVVGSGAAYIVSSRFALDPEGNLVLSDTASSAIRIVLP